MTRAMLRVMLPRTYPVAAAVRRGWYLAKGQVGERREIEEAGLERDQSFRGHSNNMYNNLFAGIHTA